MDLLIDECVPRSVAGVFKNAGHKILYVAEELGQRSPDEAVVKTTDEHGLILVTWRIIEISKS
jgi:predicted nuclease of predicted toxin-antitoxin system